MTLVQELLVENNKSGIEIYVYINTGCIILEKNKTATKKG